MELEKIIQKIKTGSREDIKTSEKSLKSLWERGLIKKSLRQKIAKTFIAEFNNFDSIPRERNQIAFISSVKWVFMIAAEDKDYFDACKNFVIKIIQHRSGHLRQAMVHVADYLIMGLVLSEDRLLSKKSDPQIIKQHQIWFGKFIEEVEQLCNSHCPKKFNRIKYISNLPPGICKSAELLLFQLLPSAYYEDAYKKYQRNKFFQKNGLEPNGSSQDFKMPKWMECTWRRVACNKMSCKICSRILRDREKHINRGEDPDDIKAVFEDVGNSLSEALKMVKKDAERMSIDITNINDIQEPPKPDEFPFYREAKKWHAIIHEITKSAETSSSLWVHTEAAADLFWYHHTLLAKIYRQLCNRWHIENGDEYGDFDYEYTQYVLDECVKILQKSITELSLLQSEQKGELMLALSKLKNLEKQISKI